MVLGFEEYLLLLLGFLYVLLDLVAEEDFDLYPDFLLLVVVDFFVVDFVFLVPLNQSFFCLVVIDLTFFSSLLGFLDHLLATVL